MSYIRANHIHGLTNKGHHHLGAYRHFNKRYQESFGNDLQIIKQVFTNVCCYYEINLLHVRIFFFLIAH